MEKIKKYLKLEKELYALKRELQTILLHPGEGLDEISRTEKELVKLGAVVIDRPEIEGYYGLGILIALPEEIFKEVHRYDGDEGDEPSYSYKKDGLITRFVVNDGRWKVRSINN
jgi:hypothetical protein